MFSFAYLYFPDDNIQIFSPHSIELLNFPIVKGFESPLSHNLQCPFIEGGIDSVGKHFNTLQSLDGKRSR